MFYVIAFDDVFEHIPNPAGTVDASTEHLAPGGLSIINCPIGVAPVTELPTRPTWDHGPFDRMWQRHVPSPHVWYIDSDICGGLAERGLGMVTMFDLMPIALRGISHRPIVVRKQSLLLGAAALLGVLLLKPFLARAAARYLCCHAGKEAGLTS